MLGGICLGNVLGGRLADRVEPRRAIGPLFALGAALVLGSLWFVLALQAPSGSFLQAFAAASGMIQWQAFVVALYPFCFIEMDGYHVLVDVLGVPTLKSDALGYVGALLRGRGSMPDTREEWLWIGYVLLSIVSITGFIALNVWLLVHAA